MPSFSSLTSNRDLWRAVPKIGSHRAHICRDLWRRAYRKRETKLLMAVIKDKDWHNLWCFGAQMAPWPAKLNFNLLWRISRHLHRKVLFAAQTGLLGVHVRAALWLGDCDIILTCNAMVGYAKTCASRPFELWTFIGPYIMFQKWVILTVFSSTPLAALDWTLCREWSMSDSFDIW